MNLIQLTPGAGAMYCGGCLRDNALVAALRRLGHEALMVPLYLPLTLDEDDQSSGSPIFFGGINVYLDQQSAQFRRAPNWLRELFDSRRLLGWAGGKAAGTRPAELGELTLSMLRGEAGNQARALAELIAWLKTRPKPDALCLSNALLIGMTRRLKSELGAAVVCSLQGEDAFLDGLPEDYRTACWRTLAERAAEVDLFLAPSRYFGDLMRQRLGLRTDQVRVVHNGINLRGYEPAGEGAASAAHDTPRLGFFARMCPEKGLDTLVDAFIDLRKRGRVGDLRLLAGGSCGPADRKFVDALRARLAGHQLSEAVEFHPNLDRAEKIRFLRSLSVFSVPARYGEAFGLYVIEALAAGVPVVQPRTAAFPELIEATGGGLLYDAADPRGLAETIEALLLDRNRARLLGDAGTQAVQRDFTDEAMAHRVLTALEGAAAARITSV